jgi:transcriptional regulator with XRE-family HTH domain
MGPENEAGRSFGTLLRQYRVRAGLTQEELAERARLSRRSITAIERGLAHRPRRDTLELLAEALALTVEHRALFLAAGRRWGTEARRDHAEQAATAATRRLSGGWANSLSWSAILPGRDHPC